MTAPEPTAPDGLRDTKHVHRWIGDNCPEGWRRVGSIDVADPADVALARDRGRKIGEVYDGYSGSVAEPCCADTYARTPLGEEADNLRYDLERAQEAHLHLCEALGLQATQFAYLDAAKILAAKDAALAASREAEARARVERDEAREEVELVRDDSVDQTRMLDSIAGRLGLAHDEGLDDAGPFLAAIERLSDALAAANARAERLAEALRPFAAVTPSTLHPDDGSDREGYSVVLCHPADDADFCGDDLACARAALAKPAAETQETGTREAEDGR